MLSFIRVHGGSGSIQAKKKIGASDEQKEHEATKIRKRQKQNCFCLSLYVFVVSTTFFEPFRVVKTFDVCFGRPLCSLFVETFDFGGGSIERFTEVQGMDAVGMISLRKQKKVENVIGHP